MFEVRNEDGQVISTHDTNDKAQQAARHYRLDREMGYTTYEVYGPVAESCRQ